MKIKEREKIDKYLNLARKLKEKTVEYVGDVIKIVVGALGTVPKSSKKDWKNWKSKGESKPS